MQTLSPMVTWSAMPTCPARKQLCPTFEVPAMPVWAEETVFSPICTLWPIWIRLSSFTPRRMIVESVLARSMQVLAPISTSSSTTTLPSCGILSKPPAALGMKPKPSAPITAPACRMQRRADHAPLVNLDTRVEDRSVADGHAVTDIDLGIDLAVGADAGSRLDNGEIAHVTIFAQCRPLRDRSPLADALFAGLLRPDTFAAV